MTATILNPTQQHLLRIFGYDNSEEYAREVQTALVQYFKKKLEAEDNRLWDEGILSQERLNELRHTDFHEK
ncbi:MAG: hypothetical protein J5770_02805 [Bacteroidaceae bacterium]|nr:hypothetical protein [Bacteroidaceae bacterium]MBR5697580.1 hypothetical protein [Prevotella sp.]